MSRIFLKKMLNFCQFANVFGVIYYYEEITGGAGLALFVSYG